jgi:hypothetical protein
MFLIRGAFWLGVAIMLLPTEERNQAKLMSTVSATAERVVTFCDRNPVACRRGAEYWAVFTKKAEFGARMLIDVANERGRNRNDVQNAVATGAGGVPSPRSEPAAALPHAKVKTETITRPARSADAADSIEAILGNTPVSGT